MNNEPEKKAVVGRNGGVLYPQQSGSPALPGAGRKPNPFREFIKQFAEDDTVVVVDGRLIGEDGNPTGEPVKVAVTFPGALAVVLKAFKQAKKGDAQARKWLTETGWGKTINLADDLDNPLGGGFVLVLPENKR